MMLEIYTGGPVVAGFEASTELYAHLGNGVFEDFASAARRGPYSAAAAAATAAAAAAAVPPAEASAMQSGVGNGASSLVENVSWKTRSGGTNATASSRGSGGVARRLSDKSHKAEEEVGQPKVGPGVTAASVADGVARAAENEAEDVALLASDSFQTTNHAVLVVGWGTFNGTKYWVAQNTWGLQWGDEGYFRMRRGVDNSAFESMVVAIDVEGALPLPLMQAADDDVAARGALRRLALRKRKLWQSLRPDDVPAPSSATRYVQMAEPRSADAFANSNLDAIAHWQYGG